ncbi:putative Meiosis arrest female protein 1-like protein [Hypsibius exemplaris]|uniref:Meiosis arrest female protein 1-like protein n=1 Tax=Hypsibius exemplaris TaxID=2072580 RepID=A0A1W0WPD1_HYPEX|nr:putative Meiosis arrest female protein 1-like protein [Hypsibius exemplaris]
MGMDRTPTQKGPGPLVAFFWDIENCEVRPDKYKQAGMFVEFLRQKFGYGVRRREIGFTVVCDTTRTDQNLLRALNEAHITLIHVPNVAKNAADDKLRSEMRKYCQNNPPGSVLVLISGDINFAPELQAARDQHGLDVLIIHRQPFAKALLATAKEHYIYAELFEQAFSNADATVENNDSDTNPADLLVIVEGLPIGIVPEDRIRDWISLRVDKTGGKVGTISREEGRAEVKFKTPDGAIRSRGNLDGQLAFGYPIRARFYVASTLLADETASRQFVQPQKQQMVLPQCNEEISNCGPPQQKLQLEKSQRVAPATISQPSKCPQSIRQDSRTPRPAPSYAEAVKAPVHVPHNVEPTGHHPKATGNGVQGHLKKSDDLTDSWDDWDAAVAAVAVLSLNDQTSNIETPRQYSDTDSTNNTEDQHHGSRDNCSRGLQRDQSNFEINRFNTHNGRDITGREIGVYTHDHEMSRPQHGTGNLDDDFGEYDAIFRQICGK